MKKILMILIGVITVSITIFLVVQGNPPEFFDIFGLFVFVFLFIIGFWTLKSKKRLPEWAGFIILLIAILGLIVDSSIVIKTFILGG
jgi:peptidoglycan/LPS O-acetylase OafA/YrhL